MEKKLVIVESPAKAKTIAKFLGSSYVVKSSVGHVRDLPTRSLGVDLEKEFEPEYVLLSGKKKVVDELRKSARECDAVYLAPDPDREGEAIAWHLWQVLLPGNRKKPFMRVSYNEVTERAVRAAFENPQEIDQARVDAQQARRILDRIVGYKVSPVLWRRVQKGLSAGRVQSVALRLVCEREQAIEEFIPEPYWIFSALLRKQEEPLDPFKARLIRVNGEKAEIHTELEADRVRESLDGSSLEVVSVNERTVRKRAFPPFITSTLQQAASSFLGFSPSRTMMLAQKLYEGVELGGEGSTGLITYMRTDSLSISAEARESARTLIVERYGKEYYPATPNMHRSRGSAQEAHEAIRPTDVFRDPKSLEKILDRAELRLYELIWKRFVASQMAPARLNQRTVQIEAVAQGVAGTASATDDGEDTDKIRTCTLSASSTEVAFPGYMEVTGIDRRVKERNDKDQDDEEEDSERLPPLREGEGLEALEWHDERKETRPPSRYSEASLIKSLEANGVGRPSTYAGIISTLLQREYAERQKRTLIPTELGRRTNNVLVGTFPSLFEVGFTAGMEAELDEVENGKESWKVMLRRFYNSFEEWLRGARSQGVDPAVVRRVLVALETIENWAPEVKHGKRTYSDEKFVASIRKQFEATIPIPITERQLEALLKLLLRYRDQISETEQILEDLGREDLLHAPDLQPPRKSTRQKLDWLKKAELPTESARFVGSLAQQVTSGRRLSDAQLRVLDDILAAQADKIEGLTEAILLELGIEPRKVAERDAIGDLLDAFSGVQEWRPASKRGKRVYDDEAFISSVSEQFQVRGNLTPAQKAAVKRMAARYHTQLENYEKLAEQHDLPPDGAKAAPAGGRRKRRPGSAESEGEKDSTAAEK